MQLEQNIKGLCSKYGLDFQDFMSDLDVEDVHELTIFDLEAICEEYEIDMLSLLFKPIFRANQWKTKTKNIKLFVVDIDGVLTDGGMYFSESGDQMKKYNTKDGMGIMKLQEKGIQVAFLSSGFTNKMISSRAEMLGVKLCYVGRDKKIDVLSQWLTDLSLDFKQVAYLGDDVNDLGCIRKVGLSACPSNALNTVKTEVDIILSLKGGGGCAREFIDNYLLESPISD
jgi:YrbI family 3-deoxy-D-manno-octulosonate 8-phosphate phosphatase